MEALMNSELTLIVCGACGCEGSGDVCFVCGSRYEDVGTAKTVEEVIAENAASAKPVKTRAARKPKTAPVDLTPFQLNELTRKYTDFWKFDEMVDECKARGFGPTFTTDGKAKRVLFAALRANGVEPILSFKK